MLQPEGTLDRNAHAHTRAHTQTHTHQSADKWGPCLHSQPPRSATLAIWVGRDNCNCRIKSSDVQLICFSAQECSPLLNGVRISAFIFTFGSFAEHELDSQIDNQKMLLKFLSCSWPVHICKADLLFIDLHSVNFCAFLCSLHSNPPTLARELLKISHLQCRSDLIFFLFCIASRTQCKETGAK